MVCKRNDSDGDDVAEEFVNSNLDLDYEGEDGDVQHSKGNNSESDCEEIDKPLPAKKAEN